ncbi:SMI1/KNR4 family protein [Streptomyces sp. NBS 14/10]|uniref:SMI1/KNR4 family protein n=1 Tax=Streptomyces sp. NBS 14/10 TaxID=1945643 RepID=UPI000B7EEFFE|nr:SMI1/KNR4 family protein [Streptomyces sp. NBS 14/10]KAK1178168.1 SMI1/KNR4 family protein [Streptomyces sp. NBS 14/10]
MNREQWRPFLQRWSEEWIDSHDPEKDAELDEAVVRDRWLGFAPASEEEIAAAEVRLGRTLPVSLREFLAVTNGWRDAGCFIYRLAGTAELKWLADSDRSYLIDIYDELAEGDAESEDEEEGDEEEEEEDADVINEAAVLRRSLLVSLDGDAADILLDPGDVNERGEWTAYWLASWSGNGLEPFDSFYELMYDQYKSFHALRKPEGETKDRWNTQVEEARLAALKGEIDGPLKVLTDAEEFGNERALLLRFQMLTMLGGGEHEAGISHVVNYAHHPGILQHPLFGGELLPLVFEEDRTRDLPHGWSTLRFSKENGPEWLRSLIADHEARRAAPDFQLSFGNPEFNAAVHRITDRLSADPVFQVPDPYEEQRRNATYEETWGDGQPVMRVEISTLTVSTVLVSEESEDGVPADFEAHDPFGAYDRARERQRQLIDAAWPELKEAIRLWRPLHEDHIAPVVLFADPVLAEMITGERGREILSMGREVRPEH